MANTSSIQFKRSSVEGKVPSTANLSIGELALNLTDKKGFTKDTNNNIITIFDYKLSNDSYYIAISAYDQANTATNIAISAYDQANTANQNATNASYLSIGTIDSNILGRSVLYIGTTSVALNRASNIQGLSGISSISNTGAVKIESLGSNIISANTNGIERFRINESGNIGIGTNNPTEKLSVSGNVAVNGVISITSSNLIANLNADLLDNQHGSYYTTLSNTATNIAISAYNQANTATNIAISAYDQANTKFNSSGGTISGDVIVTGNITVQGTTTTVNSDIVTIKDANIVIANVSSPTDITANNGGLTVLGTTNKYWNWLNTSNSWTSSEHIDIAQGKSYKINRITVLSNTTLGSGILYSSLTSVGTLTNLVVNGNVKSNTANLISDIPSTNTTTGTLIVTGGVGVSGNVNISDTLSANNINIQNTKFTANIGNGSNTVYSITHNLNKTNIISMVLENSTGNIVYPDIVYSNSNVIQVSFVSAPSSNQYSINLIGL